MIKPSASMYLRPDDEIEIEQVRMKITRDDLELRDHFNDIQVKSSGQIDVGSDSKEQHTWAESFEFSFPANPPISTPDQQLSLNQENIETVVETPAASSRHQQPSMKLSPILSSIAENAIKGNEDSESWGSDLSKGEILSQLKNVAEPYTRSPSPRGPIISKLDLEPPPAIQNSIQVSVDVVDLGSELQDEYSIFEVEPGRMNDVHTDTRQSSPIPSDHPKNDTQNSTRERGDRLLQAAIGSQERLSNPPPSSPVAELSANGYESLKPTTDFPIIDSSGLESPNSTSNRSSLWNELKRKRDNDDSQGGRLKTVQVEIPMKEPASATKSVSKNRKRKLETPTQNFQETLTKKQKHNPTTPTPATKFKPAKSQKTQASRESIEPTSSSRSTRSSSINLGARVLFASSTTVDKQTKLMSFLGKQKIRKAKSVADCDFLCIGKGELKKTSNLVMAVVSGKQVISDDWVIQSAAEGELLETDSFLARDATREAEWGINLDQAIQRGKDGIKPLAGLSIHFSPAAKKELGKGYSELKDIAMLAGAASVQATLPRKSSQDPFSSSSTIVITTHSDRDRPTLAAGGYRCYSKDIMTLSVLRGRLDAESDEFLITGPDAEELNIP